MRGSQGRPSTLILWTSVVYYCTFFCWQKLWPKYHEGPGLEVSESPGEDSWHHHHQVTNHGHAHQDRVCSPGEDSWHHRQVPDHGYPRQDRACSVGEDNWHHHRQVTDHGHPRQDRVLEVKIVSRVCQKDRTEVQDLVSISGVNTVHLVMECCQKQEENLSLVDTPKHENGGCETSSLSIFEIFSWMST